MKTVLIATLVLLLAQPAGERWLKGIIHTHSHYSDGQFTFDNQYEKLEELGIDFWIPTEHYDCFAGLDHSLSEKWKPPHHHDKSNNLDSYLKEIAQLQRKMLVIPGLEISVGEADKTYHHMLALGIDGTLPPWKDFELKDQEKVCDMVINHNGLCGIAHPSFGFDIEEIDHFSFLGFFNTSGYNLIHLPLLPVIPNAEEKDLSAYLKLIRFSITSPDYHKRISITGDNDSHLSGFDKNYTYVYAEQNQASILSAISAGKTYASADGTFFANINPIPSSEIINDFPLISGRISFPEKVVNEKLIIFGDGEEKVYEKTLTQSSLDFSFKPQSVSPMVHAYVIYIPHRLITSPIVFDTRGIVDARVVPIKPPKKKIRLCMPVDLVKGKKLVWSKYPNDQLSVAWRGSYYFHEPRSEGSGCHPGVDIVVGVGTKVKAITDAVVFKIGNVKGWGNFLVLKFLYNGKFYFPYYAHLDNIVVKIGQKVKMGQQIAFSGATGPTSPHLHFGIDKEWSVAKNTPFYPSRPGQCGQCPITDSHHVVNNFDLDEQVLSKTENPLWFITVHGISKVEPIKDINPIKPKNTIEAIVFNANFKTLGTDVYVGLPNGKSIVRLTDNPEKDESPELSSDGKKIVFTSHRDGNSEIYIMDADGLNQKRLTNHSAQDFLPRFVDLGTKVIFTSDRSGAFQAYELALVNRNVKQITFSGVNNGAIYGPDKQLYFSRVNKKRKKYELWKSKSGQEQSIFAFENNPIFPRIAFDGSITFTSDPLPNYVWFLKKGETKAIKIADGADFPSFSPNGKKIIFGQTDGKIKDLYYYSLPDKNFTQVTNVGSAGQPFWGYLNKDIYNSLKKRVDHLKAAIMCKDGSKNKPVFPTTIFNRGQLIWVYLEFENLNTFNRLVSIRFKKQDIEVWTSTRISQDYRYSPILRFGSYLETHSIARQVGTWDVDIFMDGKHLKNLKFYIKY